MLSPLPAFLLGLAAIGFMAVQAWLSPRAEVLLEQWLFENNLWMVEAETRFWRRGPFYFGETSKLQVIYRVLVENEAGQHRHVWVCCGGKYVGLFRRSVRVAWEEPAWTAPSE
jgi:hypothetical protein